MRYYWGERGWGYLQDLYPFVFLFTAFVFWISFKTRYVRYAGFAALLLVFVLLLHNDIDFLKPRDFELEMYRETAIIKQQFPNQKITLYNCGDSYSDRVQAISFLLTEGDLISDKGKKLGITITDKRCPFPKDEIIARKQLPPAEEAQLLKDHYPRFGKDDLITDYSIASEAALKDAGWRAYTPSTVYDTTVRWWFKEQP